MTTYKQARVAEIRRSRLLIRRRGHQPADRGPMPIWQPPEVKILTLDELQSLPDVRESSKVPGVYFHWLEGVLQYVGSSHNVRTRVTEYILWPKWKIDRMTHLLIPWPWHLAVEALYIRHYSPPQNSTHVAYREPVPQP